MVSRLIYSFKKNVIIGGDDDSYQLEVSHICHNTRCVNIDHLSLEPHIINELRRSCKLNGFCHKRHIMDDVVFHN